MILAVDIGNTTVALSALEKENGVWQVRYAERYATAENRTEADCQSALAPMFHRVERLEGAVLVSVVPRLNDFFRRSLRNMIGSEPLCITRRCDCGLTFDIENPEQLGLDRFADSAWAAHRYPLPVITADLGTATTFNVVDTGGIFRGGAIAPGLETGLCALAAGAAQLPDISVRAPETSVGRNTEECMRIGAVAGHAAMIDGLVENMERQLGCSASLVLTGGHAAVVAPLCRHPHVYDPDLLARGLGLLWERNAGTSMDSN